jgi:hypothetical protein
MKQRGRIGKWVFRKAYLPPDVIYRWENLPSPLFAKEGYILPLAKGG